MPARRAGTNRRPRKPAASRQRKRSSGGASVPILRQIFAVTRSPAFQQYLKDLLVELCRIDTTPKPDVTQMQAAEAQCFGILERELRGLSFSGGRVERRPVNPAIQAHPNYSLLHFTKTPQRPQGLSAEETYANRSNLIYVAPGAGAGEAGESKAVGLGESRLL